MFDTTVSREHDATAVLERNRSVSAEFSVAANSDVRRLTQRIAQAFMEPVTASPASQQRPAAPKRCRFQWGSFQFTGMVSSYNETLDYFSPQGVPLRAALSLTLKEDRFQFDIVELPGGDQAQPATPSFASGGESISAQKAAMNAGHNPKDWRQVAHFNGLENPRVTPPTGLSIPDLDVQLNATSGIAALAFAPKLDIKVGGGVGAGSPGLSATVRLEQS